MAMQQIITKALEPYKAKMATWDDSDIELLFMGFGNISVFWADEDPVHAEDLSGSFTENAKAIDSALKELGLNNGKWSHSDFYWVIHSNAGEPRSDLVAAIESAGFKCFDYFDAEDNPVPQKVKTFKEHPYLF